MNADKIKNFNSGRSVVSVFHRRVSACIGVYRRL